MLIETTLAALLLTDPRAEAEGDFAAMVARAAEALNCEEEQAWKTDADDERGGDVRVVRFACPDGTEILLLFAERAAGDWYVAPAVFRPGLPPAAPLPATEDLTTCPSRR